MIYFETEIILRATSREESPRTTAASKFKTEDRVFHSVMALPFFGLPRRPSNHRMLCFGIHNPAGRYGQPDDKAVLMNGVTIKL